MLSNYIGSILCDPSSREHATFVVLNVQGVRRQAIRESRMVLQQVARSSRRHSRREQTYASVSCAGTGYIMCDGLLRDATLVGGQALVARYAQQPKPPCKKCRARSSVTRTTPNLTRISPLRAGEVGGALSGQPTLLRSGSKGVPVECFPTPARETNQTARTRFPTEAPVRRRRDTRPRVLRASAALVQVTVGCPPGGACPGSFPNTSYTSPLEYVGLVFSVALSIQHILPLNSLLRPSQRKILLTSLICIMHMH